MDFEIGVTPLWMTFNTEPSANNLETYLNKVEPYEIYMMLFAHGTESVGLAPIERWRTLLKKARKANLRAWMEKRYPRDFAVFARYHSSLQEIPGRYPLPEPLPLKVFSSFSSRKALHMILNGSSRIPGGENNTLKSEARVFYSRD